MAFKKSFPQVIGLLVGSAQLNSLEEEVEVTLRCLRGHVDISGSLVLSSGLGKLDCSFETDQSFLDE